MEVQLRSSNFLFDEPDSNIAISAGFSRDWPDARGVYVTETGDFFAWVNEGDHLVITSVDQGGNLKNTFERLCSAHAVLETKLASFGTSFCCSTRLGFLGSDPSNLGTCLSATIVVSIPNLAAKSSFGTLCKKLNVQARMSLGSFEGDNLWEISNTERLGSSEVDQVNCVIQGVCTLVKMETLLQNGDMVSPAIDDAWELPSSLPMHQPVISENKGETEDEASSKERSDEMCSYACEKKEHEMLRANVMSMLIKAYEDGSFQKKIAEAVPLRQVQRNDIEALRQQMQTLLINAEKDGSLAKLFTTIEDIK